MTIHSYDIYVDADNNANDDFTFLTSTANTFFSINTGVIQGTIYKFRITAQNTIGSSPFSDTGSALAASTPAQPNAVTKKSADSTAIVVQWTASDDRGSIVLNYLIYWDNGTGSIPRTLLTTTANTVFEASTTFFAANLNAGQTYQFAMRAVNQIGQSQYSSTTQIIAATVPG